ncbi:MAG: histidine kinase [Actinomycetota bacterium]|nr:histidine kinase [Actinomycetota bacterium]
MPTARPAAKPTVAHAALAIGVVLALATVAAHAANRNLPVRQALPDVFQPFWLINASSTLLFTISGWYLATKRPGVIFGWLALTAGIAHGLAGLGLELAVAVGLGHHHLPAPTFGLWLAAWCPLVEQPILTAIYALYPDGRLPVGWKRWVVSSAVFLAIIGVLDAALDPLPGHGASGAAMARWHNPLSVALARSSADLAPVFFAPSAVAVIVVLVLRWRAARGDERRVLSWIVAVGIPVTIIVPISVVALPAGIGTAVAQGTTLLEIAVIVAATLRYRVYGIEVILNRALVYSALTAVVVGVFGAAVGVAGLLGTETADAPSFLGALAAALVLLPARTRIQRSVNHLLYGQRDEPSAVMSRVAGQLGAAGSTEELISGLVTVTAAALRVPYVGVELIGPDRTQVIAHGTPGEDPTRIPLVHQGRTIGALVVGRRPGERDISDRERALLNDLATQAAVAAANVSLTEDLRRSRERMVAAREEERRRLRNDLHDGLGPQLTGVALGLDLVIETAEEAAPQAAAAAERLRTELEDAIADIRRLVQGLRPPRLDEVGLCGALREMVARAERSGLVMVTQLPDNCPTLPAAIEVAAFRIATEAITNVVRHADARSCVVRLHVTSELHLTVSDDGRGLNGSLGGVGTTSMRERAEELGGSCTVGPDTTGGCRVDAHIPVLQP